MGSKVIALVAVRVRILENRVGKLERPEFHPHPQRKKKQTKTRQPLTKYQKIRKIIGLKMNLCR